MRLMSQTVVGWGSSEGIAPKIERRLHMKTFIALHTPDHGQLPESQRELCHDLFGTSKFCFSSFKSRFKHENFPFLCVIRGAAMI